jgi:hypothetical protein
MWIHPIHPMGNMGGVWCLAMIDLSKVDDWTSQPW